MPKTSELVKFEAAVPSTPWAQKVVLESNAEAEQVADTLVQMKATYEALDAQRKRLKAPILQAGKELDAEANKVLKPLEKIVDKLEALLSSWEYACRTKVLDTVSKEAMVVMQQDPARANDMMHFAGRDRADCGNLHNIRWLRRADWEVTDMAQIPLEYLCVDEKKLKAALLDGKVIPGVFCQVNISPACTTRARRKSSYVAL